MDKGAAESTVQGPFTSHYTQADVQNFFEELEAEARVPWFGDHAKTYTQNLLNRAIERGLYKPKEQK